MASQVAVHQGASVQVRLPGENSEARRHVAAHPTVAHPDEPGIFGLEEEHPQGAAHLNRLPMPMPGSPQALPRRVAATQAHPADRAGLAV
jgi:hypothetical protein